MTTILAFLFVLGVLIFVHELGHFVMARRVGVRVLKFSLGFGPRLVGFTRGDTEYVISAIPLGGYVKMAGENPDDPRSGRDDEFLSKSKWERFQILIMGPLMNLILAVVVTAGVLMNGAEIPAYQSKPPVVGYVTPDSPAAKAGIQRGDLIVSVAGRDVSTWEQFFVNVGTRAERETDIAVLRDGKQFTVKATPAPQTRFEIGDVGVFPDSHPTVGALLPGGPAEKAGLKVGDVILRVDDATITLREQLVDAVSKKANTPVRMAVTRAGSPLDVTVVPEANTGRCPSLASGAGCIGISIGEEVIEIKPGPIEAVGMSIKRNYESAGLIFMTIGQLITRETSTRQLMGPLAIAQLSGESASQGWVPLFGLMASISLNLGLLNLLPIPVLDGGHIFIMALEGLARRDFSLRVKEKMFLAGFAVLLMLMVTVIYNDLTRIPVVERLCASFPDQIAALIVEPIDGNMGVVLPEPRFLQGLRDVCTRYRIVLIFDEVITGFRIGSNGAQGWSGIVPDLTCLGKIIGGGLPVGAYGGRVDLMRLVAPSGPVYQAGTLSGNPLAMSAGLWSLKRLSKGLYKQLAALGAQLAEGLADAARRAGVPLQVNGIGSALTPFFTAAPVTNYQTALRSDAARYGVFFKGMLARGVYPPPSQFEAWFLSAAHTSRDVDKTIRAASEAMKDVARH